MADSTRLKQLRAGMRERSLDAVLVSHIPHIRYYSGFSGSSGLLLVTPRKATLVTDFRYKDQVASELRDGVKAFIFQKLPFETMMSEGIVESGMKLGFQDGYTTVAAHGEMKRKLKKIKLEPTGSFVGALTMAKTVEEIASIKKAADIAAKVYKDILTIARPGVRENELAMEISYRGRQYGSEGDAFDIIVASGPRGALPHGRASSRKIRKGEMVTLDFGCIYNGFNSDMTRTFAVGTPSDEARKIYQIVLDAEQKGVKAARPGITGKQLDDVCRDLIKAAGYGDQFGHGTGHGLGIEVHEAPAVSFRGEVQTLAPGMVVTIEPGIYLPDRCGVRIEDDVAITERGCRVLTSAPRELIIL